MIALLFASLGQLATAQQVARLPEGVLRVASSPVHVGTLDLDSGSWLPPLASLSAAPDVIYDNTCLQGYYFAVPSDVTVLDEGRVPSPTSPNNSCCSSSGCAEYYTVDAFQITYCTTDSPTTIELAFHASYQGCSDPSQWPDPPLATILLTGLPGPATPSPTAECFTVDVLLGAQSFVLPADGDGVYESSGLRERFGWTIRFLDSDGSDGPMIGTDPWFQYMWGGTVWDPLGQDNLPCGAGMGTYDFFYVDGGPWPWAPGCWPYRGIGFDSFALELRSNDACPETGAQSTFCAGTAERCPCANGGTSEGNGCDNAQSTGGVAIGAPQFQPDGLGGGTATLAGTSFPSAAAPTAIVLRSDLPRTPPTAFGDGLLCLEPPVVRMAAAFASQGTSSHPLVHGAGPGTFAYQIWYRNAPAAFCDPASAFNLSNAILLTW